VSDAKQHLFQLFPEVTFWDTAQKTNRKKRPLFLACEKDGNNSSFTGIYAQQIHVGFQLVVDKAMPALLGSSLLKEKMLLLTDSDRNEYQPL
jgi:hypothetical protein